MMLASSGSVSAHTHTHTHTQQAFRWLEDANDSHTRAAKEVGGGAKEKRERVYHRLLNSDQ